MSFRAVAEVVVHFETFRNVDLFHQGIYFLRTSLYYQKESSVIQFKTNDIVVLRPTLYGVQPEGFSRQLVECGWGQCSCRAQVKEKAEPRAPQCDPSTNRQGPVYI